MKLFHRQKANPSTPEAPQPDYSKPKPTVPAAPEMSRGARLVAIPRLVVLIAVMVILGIGLAYNSTRPATSPKKTPAKSSTSHYVQKAPSAPQSAAPGNNNGTHPATTGNLTNTGPGDVIGWFITTSIAATGLHYLIILRRLKTN